MKISIKFLIVALVLMLVQTSCSKKAAQLAEIRAKADKGDAKAQYELGRCYTKIYGLSQVGPDRYGLNEDDVEAVKWFHKSAEQNFVPAQIEMGKRCFSGFNIVKDEAAGIEWYRKAANQDDDYAQVAQEELAFHLFSYDTAKDYNEAYKWLIISTKNNSNQDVRTHFEAKMTPEQIAEGKRRADEWLAQHKKSTTNP